MLAKDFFVRSFKYLVSYIIIAKRLLADTTKKIHQGAVGVLKSFKIEGNLFTGHFAVRVLYNGTAPSEKYAVGKFTLLRNVDFGYYSR